MDKRFILNVLLAGILLATLTSCETIETGGPYEQDDEYYGNDRARDFGPYDVMVFEHQRFQGREQMFSLTRDMRQLLVSYVGGMNDRISSIRCGSRVGIALFKHRDFKGPMVIYTSSTDLVDMRINDWASSLIIFDRNNGGPLGAWVGGPNSNKNQIYDPHTLNLLAFLPLPQNFSSRESQIRHIDEMNDRAKWVYLGPAPRGAFLRSRYRERRDYRERNYSGGYRRSSRGIQVYAYEHSRLRGRSIALPPRGSRGDFFWLNQFGFENITSSFVVREY